MMARHVIGPIDEFSSGEGKGVMVDGVELAVFAVDGEVYAVQNVCPHKEGPLYRSRVDEESCVVYCPWHYWEFDLATGANPVDGSTRLRTFKAGVKDGEIWVEV